MWPAWPPDLAMPLRSADIFSQFSQKVFAKKSELVLEVQARSITERLLADGVC